MSSRLFHQPKRQKLNASISIRIEGFVQSVKHVCRHSLTTLFTWLVIGIALCLTSGLWLFSFDLPNVLRPYAGDTGFSVYFEPETDSSTLAEIVARVESNSYIKNVELTTATQALAEFTTMTGLDDELSLLDTNPLPASIAVHVKDGATSESLDNIVDWLKAHEQVDSLTIDWGWMTTHNSYHQFFGRALWITTLLFGIGSLFVIVSAIRSSVESRRDEIRLLSYLGASARDVRRPFVYCGAIYGLGGGVTAASLLALTTFLLSEPVARVLGEQDVNLAFQPLTFMYAGVIVFVGLILGSVVAAVITSIQVKLGSSSSNQK